MAIFVCHAIAYIQILSAGYNLWGIDPRILVNLSFGRNTILVALFLVVQLLGLIGAILIIQEKRLGYNLSIVHHILLLPALVITSTGFVMLMDDRLNLTLLFMNKPGGKDIALYWSLGWTAVFQQVTRNVPTGSTYFGINLFAFACATQLWIGMDEIKAAKARQEREIRRRQRQRQTGRPQQALPPPRRQPQEQRMRPQQNARQQRRPPPDWEFD